ncbi:MAG: hypothetical protein AAFX87_26910, partial [Bacteroidota bacterium]
RTLKSGAERLDDGIRERQTHSVLLETGYTFNDRFSTDLFLSFVRQERRIFSPFGNNTTITNGIGDAVVLFKYRVTNINSRNTLLIGAGPKIPLGTTEKLSDQGFGLPADLQPGSGSWDGVFWANLSTGLGSRKSMSFSLTTIYRLTGANNDYLGSVKYEFGDDIQILAGIADRVAVGSKVIDPSFSLRYRRAARDRNNDQFIEATGGEWVFAVPSIKYLVNNDLSASVTLELPIYSFVNNTQLTPSQRFTLGFYYLLNRKES